jgi:hypothetical protein
MPVAAERRGGRRRLGGMTRALPHPRTIAGAVIAGAVAGVTILAGIAAFNLILLPVPGFTLGGLFQFDASALVGKAAYTSGAYVALGVILHFLVAIGWAAGYAWAAERQRQLLTRPLVSGAVFGVIVYFAMQFMLFAANVYHNPSPLEFDVGVIAHAVFYGIPVALISARFCRSR